MRPSSSSADRRLLPTASVRPTAFFRPLVATVLGLAGLGAAILGSAGLVAAGLGAGCRPAQPTSPAAARPPAAAPATLLETGLFRGAELELLAEGVRPYAPRYPLWTDGAAKRRWVLLPAGATIDAHDPESWTFPAGTKLWKEFRFGRRVETRYMERTAEGAWLYATYLWSEDGREARLAPEGGLRGACENGLGTRHDVPSIADCRACHEASPSGALGFSALQLGAQRDPGAPHAEDSEPGSIDLVELLASGRLRGSATALLAAGAPIDAATPRERSVLGALHANCGGCHNGAGPLASLGLELDYRRGPMAPALRTALGRTSRYRPTGWTDALRIAPGDAEHSVLVERMASRFGATQMPPLGTHAVDETALALVRDWIRSDLTTSAPALEIARNEPLPDLD